MNYIACSGAAIILSQTEWLSVVKRPYYKRFVPQNYYYNIYR